MSILTSIFNLFVGLFSFGIKFDFLIYLLLLAIVLFGAINIYNFIRKGKY